MNSLELLMGMDYEKIVNVPTRKVKIKRLSEIAGRDFTVTLKAIPGRRLTELTGMAVKDNGAVDYGKLFDANARIVLAGLVDPDMKNPELMEHYRAASPDILLSTVFSGSEIAQMAETIRDLSGYGEDVIEEIKN